MAARSNLRICFTSLAAQTGAAQGLRNSADVGSIRMRGAYSGHVRPQETERDGEQLDLEQSGADQPGAKQRGARIEEPKRDRGGQDRQ